VVVKLELRSKIGGQYSYSIGFQFQSTVRILPYLNHKDFRNPCGERLVASAKSPSLPNELRTEDYDELVLRLYERLKESNRLSLCVSTVLPRHISPDPLVHDEYSHEYCYVALRNVLMSSSSASMNEASPPSICPSGETRSWLNTVFLFSRVTW